MLNQIFARLTALEASNAELRASNAELRASNTELQATLQTTMQAVLGVSILSIIAFLISCQLVFSCPILRIESQSTKSEIESFWT
jgi:hypothetical protein